MSEQPGQQFGFTCTSCGRLLRWRLDLAGKTVVCQCKATITVPDAPDRAAAPKRASGAATEPASGVAEIPLAKAPSAQKATARQSPAAAPRAVELSPTAPKRESSTKKPKASGKPARAAAGKPDAGGVDALAAAAERAARATAADEAGYRCPACLSPLPEDAVLCTACGTDLRTGQKVAPVDEADDEDDDAEEGAGRKGSLLDEGSTFRNLHLPIILLVLGLGLSMYEAYRLGEADGGPVVRRFLPLFVIAAAAMECVLLFAVLLASVKLFDTGLGGVSSALLLVLAATIAPAALGAMIQHAAGGGVGAMILAGLVSILLYWGLVKLFFNLPNEKAAPIVLVMYGVGNWLKPLLLSAMLMGGTAAAERSNDKNRGAPLPTAATAAAAAQTVIAHLPGRL